MVVLIAMYSTSTELSATYFYFLLHQETTPNPILKQHLEVLFRFTELSTQSTVVYPIKSTTSPQVYLKSHSIVPCRYLNRCLTIVQCTLFGSNMNRLRVLTMKQMFSLVLTRYIREILMSKMGLLRNIIKY